MFIGFVTMIQPFLILKPNTQLIYIINKIQILIGKNIKKMACNGICHRYQVTKGNRNDSWYKQGAKRCTACNIYIKWEGMWCPCCGYMLRNKPKNNQYKQRYNKNT